MKPFFSIIIPLYNKEKYITSTLDSVFNQTFDNYEIIIVNDGSTDNSIELVEKYKNPKIKVFHQKNKGVSSARNLAMENANGNFFCFLDADDIWKENHLSIIHETIEKFPEAKMYCSRYITQISDTAYTTNSFIDITDSYEGIVSDFFKSSYINRIALTSAVCIDKFVFTTLKGFDESISSGQDLDYWIKIALNYKVAITKEVTMIYNFKQDNKSLSRTNINLKTIPNFDHYKAFELKNKSLKKFLDLYRVEYALQYKIANNFIKTEELLANVDIKKLPFKTKFLLKLPTTILNVLLRLKHKLKQKGIDFTVYH